MEQPLIARDRVTQSPVVTLDDTQGLDASQLGSKAARLAMLRAAGHPVPPGVVIPASFLATATAERRHEAALAVGAILGDGPLAVRSSALAEDRADASFAGLYESVLDVRGHQALVAAIERVVQSASTARVEAYASTAMGGAIAVLIQPMVPADTAGVAFSADPVTGDRDVAIISAVAGTGDRLVSGEVDGEDWKVDRHGSVDSRGVLLTHDSARAIAALVREIERTEGCPQDIEWALTGSTLYLLQARPMTALPEQVAWSTRAKAPFWRRDFRMAEWLPDPVTPLFETWFIPQHDNGFAQVQRDEFGGGMGVPFNIVVNGWCYSSIGRPGPSSAMAFVKHPIRFGKWVVAFLGSMKGKNPARAERWIAAPTWDLYERRLDAEHRREVANGRGVVDTIAVEELPGLIDATLLRVGALTFPLVECAGFAWKAECALARFFAEHLAASIEASPQQLLAGLREPVAPAPHAVSTFDWVEPTLGERGDTPVAPTRERYLELKSDRETLERRCREVLTDPKDRRRFDEHLAIAQRYAVLREEFMADVTLSWPLLRLALLRIGARAAALGVVAQADDIFWLERDEVTALLAGDATAHAPEVASRKAEWARRRRLVPPMWLGKKGHSTKVHDRFARNSGRADDAAAVVSGVPASPGRATGPVRVVRGPADFDRVRDGDVLVAPITAPAWTPLFARVAAVITDGGSLAAHASLIAREYGIPAIVATHRATTTLVDGGVVTVDGNRGSVTRLASSA